MNNPQKIAFILPSLTAGGAERVLITLMNNINRELFEPCFIVLDETGPLRNWIADDISFHTLGHQRVRDSYLPLFKKLKQLKPDTIMTTMAHANFLILLLKPFFPETRFIVREANVLRSALQVYPRWKAALIKCGYKTLYPRADIVMSPAHCIVEEFRSFLKIDTRNHVVLYNPVNTETIFRNIEAGGKALAGNEDKNTVQFVCAGRLHYQKGFDRLIETLPEKPADGVDWHLTIMGEGKEREALTKLVHKRGLAEKVTFTGLVKNPWVRMAQADCFLLPSRWEGLPNVVLESLACGTPVIAMKEAGGIAEIAGAANRTGQKVVQIADTIEEFMALMADIRPLPEKQKKESLLPDHFSLPAAVARLENILKTE